MKSHRVLRNREKHNKRTKRRKKSKKNKMKGGAVITDTTDQQWLVCDNPYCFLNHYNADAQRDDVFHYEEKEPSGSDKHIIHVKDKAYYRFPGRERQDFYIVKKKINFEDEDEYFYIGDSFQKIREFKDDNTNPRFEIVGEQNFTESAISSRAAVSHDIIKNKNSSEQYGLSGPQSWENMLLYSVIKLLKTIEYDEKCLPEKKDIQRVLDIINSKGRRIHKGTPDKWFGSAPVADTGLQLLSQTQPKKFFEAFFGVPDATLGDFTAYTQLVKLDLSFGKDNISTLSTEITELGSILQPYGSNIIAALNENLKQYYNNRGRVLKWTAADGGIKADQSDLDGTHVVVASGIEQGDIPIQFYRGPDGFKTLTYGINIPNPYIAWKFKKYYSRVLLKLVKVGCFHINENGSLNKLNYTKDDTDSNPYHKDFSLENASVAITDAEELLKKDDIAAEGTTTEGLSDDITQTIYSKIYGADLAFIGDIDDVGSHHSLSKFKTKLNDFRSEDGKNISLKDLPYFLPFFDTADSFNSELEQVQSLYEGIDTEGQLSKMLLSNGSFYGDTEDNVRFEYLEHIYQKSSLQRGLCYCDVCKEKKKLNPSAKEELMKIKKGDIFEGDGAECSKTINDKNFELESKKLLKIYIKKALEQHEIRDILKKSKFEDGVFYEDGGGLRADADDKIDEWIENTFESEGRDDKAPLNNGEYLMKFLKEHKYNPHRWGDPLQKFIEKRSENLDQDIRSSTDLELINTARMSALEKLSELKREQEKVRNKKNEEDCEEKTKTFKSSLDAIASIIRDADITMDNLEFEKLKDQLDTYKQEIKDNELSHAHIRDTNSLDGSRVQKAVIDGLLSKEEAIREKEEEDKRKALKKRRIERRRVRVQSGPGPRTIRK